MSFTEIERWGNKGPNALVAVGDQRRGQLSLGSDLLLAARVLNLDAEESRRVVAAVHHREEPITSVVGRIISPRNELATMDMIRRAAVKESTKLEKCIYEFYHAYCYTLCVCE